MSRADLTPDLPPMAEPLGDNPEPKDMKQRIQQMETYVESMNTRFKDLQIELQDTSSRLKNAEKLNRLHPDTGLPIYRFFLQDLETLVVNGDKNTKIKQKASQTGCGDQINEMTGQQGFSVFVIRLDEAYERIRHSRDRQKALLFKSTYRIKTALDRGCLYQGDRLDEFYVLYPDLNAQGQLQKVVDAISREVSASHAPPAEDIQFGAYVGVTSFPTQAKNVEEILLNLEIVQEEVIKSKGKNCFYNEEIGRHFRYKRSVENELNKSMQRGFDQFKLVFQPICSIHGEILCAEVLVRWEHPNLGIISPSIFVPIAENNGSIRLLGRWIFFQACKILADWQKAGHRTIQMAVNLSPIQFLQNDLVDSILNGIKVNKLLENSLKLEITEGAIMVDPQESVRKMGELRNHGIVLCIDDFGTGYSSLSYLKKLPVDELKIDKSFVDDIEKNKSNQEITRAIIALAKNLHLKTLAEGVEHKSQLDILKEEGVDLIQGYYFSPPVDSDTLKGYLETGGTLPL